jgi:polyisoprenoid-binding protein YceI
MRAVILSMLVALPTVAAAQPVDWNLDRNHSTVSFVARHLGLAKVRGEFTRYDAKVEADPEHGRLTHLEAENQGPQLRTVYEATATINRKDFGLNFGGLAEGTAIVSDDVQLVLATSLWRPLEKSASKGK